MILTKENISAIDINKILNDKINNSKLEEILIIVPTNRKLRSLKKGLVLNSPNSTTGKLNIETLVTLSSKLILGENYRNNLPSEAVVSVLLSQSFKKVKLQYFNNYGENIPTGTIDKIYNVISEYKKNGITPEYLYLNIDKLNDEVEKRKGSDIINIYKEFQILLNEVKLFETGDIYKKAAEKEITDFEKSFRIFFPFVDNILISGFDEFYVPEIDIIDNLSLINNSKLFLSFDYGKNEFLFNHLKTCFGQITSKGFKVIEDNTKYIDSELLISLKENLFKTDSAKNINYKKRINIINSVNRRHEITIISKEIKKLITEKNIKPDEIAVVCNLIDNYSSLIKDIFNEYGIPINLTDRTPLSYSGPVVSIINFLEILENDFYYKTLFRALSGGYFSPLNIDISNLYKISSELGIISGYKKWINEIDANIYFINNYEDSHNIKNIYNLNKAKSNLNDIFNILKEFNNNLTPSEFNNQINLLINKLQIPLQLINNYSNKTEANIKALTDFISLLSELTELYEDEFGKEKKFDLHFYLNNLRTAVKSARFNIKERQGYGVLVTTLNEVRGLKFQYLFIAGMNDGDLPTRYTPEIFFSPEYLDKYKLKHQFGERFLFYQALSSFEKSVYLTIPATDGKKELMTSNFINDLIKQFEVNEIDSEEYDNLILSVNNLLTNYSVLKNEIEKLPISVEKDFIENTVKIENGRKSDDELSNDYKGILNIENLSAINLLDDFNNKYFSISQLELYAACPYKYFIERVLNIESLPEPDESIEKKEIGKLLHKILYEFYIFIKKENIILAGCNEKVFANACKIIIKIAKNEIEKLNFDKELNFYEYEKILGVNGDVQNSILYLFLKTEQKLNPEFEPQLFEYSFGNDNPFLIDNIKLRGKIDRIDINEKNKFVKVYDYKLSGKKPSEYELNSGLKLQLPLYLSAILNDKGENYKPAEASIYSLKFNNNDFGILTIKQINKSFENANEEFVEFNNNLIENAKTKIKEFVEGIIKGDFRLSPHDKREEIVCKQCEFKSVCRVSNLKN